MRARVFSPIGTRRKSRRLEDILRETEFQVRDQASDEDLIPPTREVIEAYLLSRSLEGNNDGQRLIQHQQVLEETSVDANLAIGESLDGDRDEQQLQPQPVDANPGKSLERDRDEHVQQLQLQQEKKTVDANLEDKSLEGNEDEQQVQLEQGKNSSSVKKRIRRLSDVESSRPQKPSQHAYVTRSKSHMVERRKALDGSSPQQVSFSHGIREGGASQLQEVSSPERDNETGRKGRLRRFSDIESSRHGRESGIVAETELDIQNVPSLVKAGVNPRSRKKEIYTRFYAEQQELEQSHSEDSDTGSIDCDAEINKVLRSLNSKGRIGVVVGKHNGKIYGAIVRKGFPGDRAIPPPSPRTEARLQAFLHTTLQAEYQRFARRAHLINEYKRLLLRALKRGRWRVSKYVRMTAKSAIRQEEVINFINKQKRIKYLLRMHGSSNLTASSSQAC